MIGLGSCSPVVSTPQTELILDQQEYTTSTDINVDRLIVRSGAHVRVRGGVSFFVRTKQLIIEGPAVIDGNGEDNPTPPRVWDSRDSTSSFDCELMHRHWAEATTDNVPPGAIGGNGASIELRYQRLEATSRPVSELTVTANGGRGSYVEVQLCGCWTRNRDSMHIRDRRESARGPSGPPGVVRVLVE